MRAEELRTVVLHDGRLIRNRVRGLEMARHLGQFTVGQRLLVYEETGEFTVVDSRAG